MPIRMSKSHVLADHSADWRMLMLAAAALATGTGGALGAWVLLKLIALATNIFWFGRLRFESRNIVDTALGAGVVLAPVIGSLLLGLMAWSGYENTGGADSTEL